MPVNTQAHLLTRKQEDAGYIVEENEDYVILKCKDEIVGTYSATGVTLDTLRTDADTHMNGIFTNRTCIDGYPVACYTPDCAECGRK